MIAALIFGASLLILLHFFLRYVHALIVEARAYELSPQIRALAAMAGRTGGGEFARLLELIALCPESGEEHNGVQAVSTYFGMLGVTRSLLRRIAPSVLPWIDTERSECTHVAAVMLDRRAAHNRMLLVKGLRGSG